jgi:hypothetical protein
VPRFYFDLHNDEDVLDREGKELSGLDEARKVAVAEAREMICASVENGKIDLNHFIEVRDEAGKTVHRLHFGQAVRIVPENA